MKFLNLQRSLTASMNTEEMMNSNILIPKEEVRFVMGPYKGGSSIVTLYDKSTYIVTTGYDEILRQLNLD